MNITELISTSNTKQRMDQILSGSLAVLAIGSGVWLMTTHKTNKNNKSKKKTKVKQSDDEATTITTTTTIDISAEYFPKPTQQWPSSHCAVLHPTPEIRITRWENDTGDAQVCLISETISSNTKFRNHHQLLLQQYRDQAIETAKSVGTVVDIKYSQNDDDPVLDLQYTQSIPKSGMCFAVSENRLLLWTRTYFFVNVSSLSSTTVWSLQYTAVIKSMDTDCISKTVTDSFAKVTLPHVRSTVLSQPHKSQNSTPANHLIRVVDVPRNFTFLLPYELKDTLKMAEGEGARNDDDNNNSSPNGSMVLVSAKGFRLVATPHQTTTNFVGSFLNRIIPSKKRVYPLPYRFGSAYTYKMVWTGGESSSLSKHSNTHINDDTIAASFGPAPWLGKALEMSDHHHHQSSRHQFEGIDTHFVHSSLGFSFPMYRGEVRTLFSRGDENGKREATETFQLTTSLRENYHSVKWVIHCSSVASNSIQSDDNDDLIKEMRRTFVDLVPRGGNKALSGAIPSVGHTRTASRCKYVVCGMPVARISEAIKTGQPHVVEEVWCAIIVLPTVVLRVFGSRLETTLKQVDPQNYKDMRKELAREADEEVVQRGKKSQRAAQPFVEFIEAFDVLDF